MTNVHETKGWRNRRKLAELKNETYKDDDRRAIRAERQRLQDEAEAASRQVAEAQAARIEAARCTCPACDGSGTLTATEAMRVIDAIGRYGFAGHAPSARAVAALVEMLQGNEPPLGSTIIEVSYGAHRPRPVGDMAPSSAKVLPKPGPTAPSKPTKMTKAIENDDAFTSDGALIEI